MSNPPLVIPDLIGNPDSLIFFLGKIWIPDPPVGERRNDTKEYIQKHYSFFALSRKELETTETLENAIASPAKIGLSSQPNIG